MKRILKTVIITLTATVEKIHACKGSTCKGSNNVEALKQGESKTEVQIKAA